MRYAASVLMALITITGCTITPQQEPDSVEGRIAESIFIDDEYDHTGD